jgi:hypothetical protein
MIWPRRLREAVERRIARQAERAAASHLEWQRTRRSSVVEAEWERSEELRPDRLGPGPDDIEDPIPVDPFRPSRTLGRLPKI